MVQTLKAFNAETANESLVDNWITPNSTFYVRNQFAVPLLNSPDEETTNNLEASQGDVKNYQIEIKGNNVIQTSLTLD